MNTKAVDSASIKIEEAMIDTLSHCYRINLSHRDSEC